MITYCLEFECPYCKIVNGLPSPVIKTYVGGLDFPHDIIIHTCPRCGAKFCLKSAVKIYKIETIIETTLIDIEGNPL